MKKLLFLVLTFIVLQQCDLSCSQKTENSFFASSNRMMLHHTTFKKSKKNDSASLAVVQSKEDLLSRETEEKNNKESKLNQEQFSFVKSNRMILSSLTSSVDKKDSQKKKSVQFSIGGLLESRICDGKVEASYVPHSFLRSNLPVLIADTKSLEDVDTEQK